MDGDVGQASMCWNQRHVCQRPTEPPHAAGRGQRETHYFYLVLFEMGLLYREFIKEVFLSLNWLLSLTNDFHIALNKSTKINKS